MAPGEELMGFARTVLFLSCKAACAAQRVEPTAEIEGLFKLSPAEEDILRTFAPQAEPVLLRYVALSPVAAAVGFTATMGFMVLGRTSTINALGREKKAAARAAAEKNKRAGASTPGGLDANSGSREPKAPSKPPSQGLDDMASARARNPLGTTDGLEPYSTEWAAAVANGQRPQTNQDLGGNPWGSPQRN